MKRIYMLAVVLSAFSKLQAQSLAVNTSGSTADNSSILDVSSTDKGMLIPRMSKAQRLAIGMPAAGLLLYQSTPDSIGFYFYNGIKWDWLVGSNTLDTLSWHTHGNAGTNVNRHYIGTIDSAALSIKTYNSERIRFLADGKIGIGVTNPFTKFSNSPSNIGGSDTIGVGNNSFNWVSNEIGYTQAVYNASSLIRANGLAIKIKGTTNKNVLLDLSTGSSQSGTGTSVLTAFGDGNIGIGTNAPKQRLDLNGKLAMNNNRILFRAGTDTANYIVYDSTANGAKLKGSNGGLLSSDSSKALYWKNNGNIGIGYANPFSQLSNTGTNIIAGNNIGTGQQSISWYSNQNGFTQALYNASNSSNAHGFAVKIAGTSNTNMLLDLSTGAAQNVAGNPVFSVFGSGKIGVGTNYPFTKLSNTETNIAGSNGAGTGPGAISWKTNEDGYSHSIYNGSANPNANGLAVKINGSSNSNILFDLSTGSLQDIPGNPVFTVLGSGKIGVGTNYPCSKFSNTETNIAGSNGAGVGLGSFTWRTNEDGFTNALFNESASGNAHGLAVKIAGSSPYNILLDLSNGAVSNAAGTSVFLVRGDGKTGIGTNVITETLTVNGAVNITDGGYAALTNNATTPVPSGAAGTMAFSNGHFFGWNGTAWKQLDN